MVFKYRKTVPQIEIKIKINYNRKYNKIKQKYEY